MRFRITALSIATLSVALCGIGRADSDHDHDNDQDHHHFNTHRADKDDCGDHDGGGDRDKGGDKDGGGDDGGSGGPGSGPGSSTSGSQLNAGGLYILQAAPGRDMKASFYPTYPIDVLVNDTTCLVQNAPFPSTQGSFVEGAGTYDLKISPANPAAPCTNGFVRETQAVVTAGQATFVAVALSQQSTMTTYTFNLPLPRLQPHTAELVIAHAADAPPLDPGSTTAPLGSTPGRQCYGWARFRVAELQSFAKPECRAERLVRSSRRPPERQYLLRGQQPGSDRADLRCAAFAEHDIVFHRWLRANGHAAIDEG